MQTLLLCTFRLYKASILQGLPSSSWYSNRYSSMHILPYLTNTKNHIQRKQTKPAFYLSTRPAHRILKTTLAKRKNETKKTPIILTLKSYHHGMQICAFRTSDSSILKFVKHENPQLRLISTGSSPTSLNQGRITAYVSRNAKDQLNKEQPNSNETNSKRKKKLKNYLQSLLVKK